MTQEQTISQGADGVVDDPTTVSIPYQKQTQSQWCCAATTTMIGNFYAGYAQYTQCQIATLVLSGQNPSGNYDCCTKQGPCNKPNSLATALTDIDCLANQVAGPLTVSSCANLLAGSQPPCLRIQWAGGGGHFMPIAGANSARQLLFLDDPIFGQAWTSYTALINGKYRGRGTWNVSYTTKTPSDQTSVDREEGSPRSIMQSTPWSDPQWAVTDALQPPENQQGAVRTLVTELVPTVAATSGATTALDVSQPVPVLNVDLQQALNPPEFASLTPVAWQYVVTSSGAAVAIVEVHTDGDGQTALSTLSFAPDTQSLTQALTSASATDSRVAVVSSPALGVAALWTVSGDTSSVTILDPSRPPFTPGQIVTTEEFADHLRGLAETYEDPAPFE